MIGIDDDHQSITIDLEIKVETIVNPVLGKRNLFVELKERINTDLNLPNVDSQRKSERCAQSLLFNYQLV